MQDLFQLQDSKVSIASGSVSYIDTIGNFKKDYSNTPDFTNDFVLYNRTLKQYVLDNTMQEYTPQKNLDRIIDSLSDIVAAQQKRAAPPLEPVTPPTPEQQIAALDDEYQAQFKDLANSYTLATMQNDNAAQEGVKSDYAGLKEEYGEKIGVITNGNS